MSTATILLHPFYEASDHSGQAVHFTTVKGLCVSHEIIIHNLMWITVLLNNYTNND